LFLLATAEERDKAGHITVTNSGHLSALGCQHSLDEDGHLLVATGGSHRLVTLLCEPSRCCNVELLFASMLMSLDHALDKTHRMFMLRTSVIITPSTCQTQ